MSRVLVSHSDGRGLDIPTLEVDEKGVEESLRALLVGELGRALPTELLGYVRNVVPQASDDYAWPSPRAHFVVWHCPVPAGSHPQGVWLEATEAVAELADRHWWPLAHHVPGFLA